MVILIGQSVDNYETFKGIITYLFNYIYIIQNNATSYQVAHKSYFAEINFKCKCIGHCVDL